MNVFYCSLDVNKFNNFFFYISAKEVWDQLEATYNEANQVKESSWKEEVPNLCLIPYEDKIKKKTKQEMRKKFAIKRELNKEKMK